MNAIDIITDTARQTFASTLAFPDVVSRLLAADVEYYHVDYIGQRIQHYTTNGGCVTAPLSLGGLPPAAPDFAVAALKSAIRDSQQHGQTYRDFSRRALEAGVQGYYTFLRGRRVTYFGRQGDSHTEWFPGAGPE